MPGDDKESADSWCQNRSVDWYAGLERTRTAVSLVLNDVAYEFGSNAATIVFESPEKLRIGGPHGWVIGT